nr:holo-ACP synthase [Candidatus Krumholzibacteria bacterium]
MSILGVGNDIVAIPRISDLLQDHGDRFLARCFTPREIAYIQSRGRGAAASAAARWAAKEAFLKALGQDVSAIPYQDIEVVRQEHGQVTLELHGKARAALTAAGAVAWHVALSHEREFAAATVILEKRG